MFKIVIVDDDRQMQAIIRDKIKEKTDAFRDAKIQIFSSAEAFLAEANGDNMLGRDFLCKIRKNVSTP